MPCLIWCTQLPDFLQRCLPQLSDFLKIRRSCRSKTVLFFASLIAAGVLQDVVHYLQPFLSPDDYGKAMAVVG